MIIKLQPILDCLKDVKTENCKVFLLSAKGEVYNQKMAHNLSKYEHVILICGHYEGVDERILNYIDGEICVGDYILTGGEIPAMIVADSIIRLIDGAIKEQSTSEESFSQGILEYPQYTRPETFENQKVPEVLLSGHHQNINKWRRYQALKNTYLKIMINFAKFYQPLNDNEHILYSNDQHGSYGCDCIHCSLFLQGRLRISLILQLGT